MSSEAFGETLHFITNVKLEELEKRKLKYTEHHDAVVSKAKDADDEPLKHLEVLVRGMNDWPGAWSPNARPNDLSQFIDHAGTAPSFPKSIVDSWISAAESQIAHEKLRFEFAALFGKLLTEWLGSKGRAEKPDSQPEEFEHVNRNDTREQKEKLESIIFEAKSVDVALLKEYLADLFSDKTASEALEAFRKRIKNFSKQLRKRDVDVDELKSVIRSVLQTDLLSDKKQATLQEFLTKPIILEELAGVLGMQLQSLETWSWPEDGVALEPRRQLNGKVRFYLDSEIMNSLLLHYVGTLWACEFRSAIKGLSSSRAWKKAPYGLTREGKARRSAFLGVESNYMTLRQKREQYQRDNYFMCQLPTSLDSAVDNYAEEPGTQATPSQWTDRGPKFDSPVDLKQSLLHMLCADIAISKFKFNECAVVRTDLEWFGPSLPFDTIIAVLQFFGMPEDDVHFVTEFLSCPIKFKDEQSGLVRIRKRGVPISHALSTLCGELVLFVMDFAVNQRADGLFLYRIHDDFWLWDTKADRCAKAWAEMQRFCQLSGMAFNASKTGSVVVRPDVDGSLAALGVPEGEVRWGFLKMDASAEFIVDQAMIDEHITEMRRQLDATSSVFEWVHAYNKYMAFIVRNCGAPVTVYGVKHVNTIIDTLVRIQRTLFEDGLNAKIGKMLEKRFGVDAASIPQGWYVWPCALGGLEVKDFLVEFFLLKNGFGGRSIEKILQNAARDEEKAYEEAKESWKEAPTTQSILSRLRDSKVKADEPFFSKEEYDRGWEECSSAWMHAYSKLLERPSIATVASTPRLQSAVQVLSSEGLAAFHSSSPDWSSFSPYWRWVIGIYHEEMTQKLGSLAIVDPSLVPVGMVSVFKSSRMRWEQ